MKSIIAADSMRDWLGGILQPVEIRDTNGKLLGRYTPTLTAEEMAFYAQGEASLMRKSWAASRRPRGMAIPWRRRCAGSNVSRDGTKIAQPVEVPETCIPCQETVMNVLKADETLAAYFRGVVEPFEIRDVDGALLGQYIPHVPPEIAAAYDRIRQLADPEELRRRANEPGRNYTTEEVIRYLESLEPQG